MTIIAHYHFPLHVAVEDDDLAENRIDYTLDEFKEILESTTDWSAVRLEKDVFESSRRYDQYATLVYIQDRRIGSVPNLLTPVLYNLIDIASDGLIELRMSGQIKKVRDFNQVWITVEVHTSSVQMEKSLKQLKSVVFDENFKPIAGVA